MTTTVTSTAEGIAITSSLHLLFRFTQFVRNISSFLRYFS